MKRRLGPAHQEETLMTALREADAALTGALRATLDVEGILARVRCESAEPRLPDGSHRFDGPVAAATRGNQRAVSQLLAAVHPLVVRYCRARIGGLAGGYASADDVAQEVCLALLLALPTYREQGKPFLAYVYGIAQHKVADAHRAAARDRTEPIPEPPEATDLADGPEDRVLRGELNRLLALVLRILPDRQREIVLLRVVVGLSAEETAEAVGSTPGAVRVAQHRALLRLRSELAR
ncbi:RNA polymerase sigma factor ShbA [Amycolatopsis ultiminotia]|uniref:RNA polymerase sigma factor ShbA n=1 Tax=Amycolatopsis ultiminotia TaxID=543629 RepID=UPI003CD0559E